MIVTDRIDGAAQGALFDIDQQHLCAFLDESFRRGAADTARATGDYRHATIELAHIRRLRFSM